MNRLRKFRQRYGVPTYVIIRATGLHENYVYKHEVGDAVPNVNNALAYAKFCSKRLKRTVTVEELFGGE